MSFTETLENVEQELEALGQTVDRDSQAILELLRTKHPSDGFELFVEATLVLLRVLSSGLMTASEIAGRQGTRADFDRDFGPLLKQCQASSQTVLAMCVSYRLLKKQQSRKSPPVQ